MLQATACLKTLMNEGPGTKTKPVLTLHCLFPDDRAEQGGPGNTLRFLEALVEGRRQRAGAASNLARHGKDGIERPWRALHQALVCIISWIKDGDEDMTPGKEST